MAQQYYLRNIRKLLEDGFSEKELRNKLCFDEPTFRAVYQQLATVTGKDVIVQHLLEYAESKSLLDELLAWAKSENLAKYEEFQPYTDAPTDVPLPQAVREAVAALNKPLQTERLAAVESLAALVAKHPIAQDKLAEVVQQADYPDVRIHAAFMLVQFKDARAVPGLVEALRDKNQTIDVAKLWDLIKIDAIYKQGFPFVANLPLRYIAAWALGYIGDSSAVQELVQCLHDKDSYIRRFAALALGQIGDINATPNLCETLNDEDWKVREFAARALGWLGVSAAVPYLVNVMHNDIDFDVRNAATWALGKIGDAEAVPDLIRALYNKSYDVRETAKKALKSIGTSEALAALAAADELDKSQSAAGI